MKTKEFRAAVFGEIVTWQAAQFPNLPVAYENGPVLDRDKVGPIFLDVEVRWYGARTMAFGSPVAGRYLGAVSTQVYYRATFGTAEVDDVIDSLQALLATRRLGSSVISFPERTIPTPPMLGWYKSGLLFPFTLDR